MYYGSSLGKYFMRSTISESGLTGLTFLGHLMLWAHNPWIMAAIGTWVAEKYCTARGTRPLGNIDQGCVVPDMRRNCIE